MCGAASNTWLSKTQPNITSHFTFDDAHDVFLERISQRLEMEEFNIASRGDGKADLCDAKRELFDRVRGGQQLNQIGGHSHSLEAITLSKTIRYLKRTSSLRADCLPAWPSTNSQCLDSARC